MSLTAVRKAEGRASEKAILVFDSEQGRASTPQEPCAEEKEELIWGTEAEGPAEPSPVPEEAPSDLELIRQNGFGIPNGE